MAVAASNPRILDFMSNPLFCEDPPRDYGRLVANNYSKDATRKFLWLLFSNTGAMLYQCGITSDDSEVSASRTKLYDLTPCVAHGLLM
jgi:hypothetical protein